jgi:hypothetical protein
MSSKWKESLFEWNAFWFTAREPIQISIVRIAIGILTWIVFWQYLMSGTDLVGSSGWFNPEAGQYLIGDGVEGTGSLFRWSPLYPMPSLSPWVAAFGLLASLAMTLGLGARLAPLIAWLALGVFHHRAPVLTLLAEPLLLSALAYLIIEPGRLEWTIKPGLSSGVDRVSANLSIQLIRCHLWIWIAFSLSSMLAQPEWWNGEAGWLLIEARHGWLRLPEGWQSVGQFMTHFVVAVQMALLASMLSSNCLWMGRWLLYLFASSILLLLGDWMYASTLLAMSLAVWPINLSLPKEKK